jgi:predicted nucleic acid-binding Zn ribbon protein
VSERGAEEPPAEPASGVDLARAALAAARQQAKNRPVDTARGSRRVRETRGDAERDPRPFGATIESLIASRGWTLPAAAAGAMERWPEIVGAEVAAKTTPESFAEGVLTVRAASTAWATQLRLMAPQIVHRLNVELGHGSVLRLAVKGPDAPNWSKGRLRVRDGRGPRDTYG